MGQTRKLPSADGNTHSGLSERCSKRVNSSFPVRTSLLCALGPLYPTYCCLLSAQQLPLCTWKQPICREKNEASVEQKETRREMERESCLHFCWPYRRSGRPTWPSAPEFPEVPWSSPCSVLILLGLARETQKALAKMGSFVPILQKMRSMLREGKSPAYGSTARSCCS